MPHYPKLAQTSPLIGETAVGVVWAVRRWVRTGWSKKMLRLCRASTSKCGVASSVGLSGWNQSLCHTLGKEKDEQAGKPM